MFSRINNYKFIARNRYITKENDDVGIASGTIEVNTDIFKKSLNLISNLWETKPMKIAGINDFVSLGYFHSPSSYSEVIENGKNRTRLPSSLNTLLGMKRIQNLYGDKLSYFNLIFPGPVSSDALDYYSYFYEDTLMMDDQKILRI